MDKGMKKVVNLVTNYMSALCETGREIARWDHHLNALVVRRCTKPTRTYQNHMNAFFKAFRVPVRVRYRNGFSLNGTHDLQTERIIRL